MADRVRAVIFDMGGVLVDDIHLPMLEKLARERYGEEAVERFVRAGITAWRPFELDPAAGEDDFWREVVRLGGLREKPEELASIVRAERLIPFPETIGVARRLKRNSVTLAVLSNHAAPWFTELFELFHLGEIFRSDLVVTSYEVGAAKPDLRMFEEVYRRLAGALPGLARSACVFIDDKPHNVEAARAFGFISFAFDSRLQPVRELVDALAAHGIDADPTGC